jgi:hypothetical protein
MLGPDFFSSILPVVPDRAEALEHAMEYAAGKGVLLDSFFATPFSTFVTQRNDKTYKLPVLCINVTRMQDGNPGLISNIDVDTAVFGRRVDVLDLLKPGTDIPLSTAVVMGARFPYLSPAGRIDERLSNGSKRKHYFVDGGYFDNSGAGAVHEILISLENMIHSDSILIHTYNQSALSKIRFIVIHVTNTPVSESKFEKIHPFQNDLAAPLLTLAGSYGTQTSVNDSRLDNYIRSLYREDSLRMNMGFDRMYFDINLYKDIRNMSDTLPEEPYPMNWSISDTTLHRMQNRLYHHPALDELTRKIQKILIKENP